MAKEASDTAAPRRGTGTEKVWTRIYLKEWRGFRGWTQEDLAEKSGVSTSMISLIETRQAAGSPDTLESLAKALGISLGELFDVEPKNDKPGRLLRQWVSDDDHRAVMRFLGSTSA